MTSFLTEAKSNEARVAVGGALAWYASTHRRYLVACRNVVSLRTVALSGLLQSLIRETYARRSECVTNHTWARDVVPKIGE